MKFSAGRFLLYFNTFLLFCIYFVNKLSSFDIRINSAPSYSLASCTIAIVISIVMISVSLATKPVKLILALFWLFNLIFLGLAQLSYICDSNPYYLASISPQKYINQASFIITIGLLTCSLVQIYLFSKMPILKKMDISCSPQELLSRAKVFFWIYFLFLFPASQLIGGLKMMFRSVRIETSLNQLSLPLYSIGFAFCYALPLVNAVIFILISKFRIEKNQRAYACIMIIWCILISNPFAAARQTTLFLLLPLIFLFIKNHPKFIFFFFLCLSYYVVYQPVGVNRFSGVLSLNNFLPLSRNGDFDSFPQISNGLYAISKGDFPFFKQIFGCLFFFVPRSVWSNKPLDTGIIVSQTNGLAFQNLSAPWLLELFVNGRLPILIIGSILVTRYLFINDIQSSVVNYRNATIAIIFGLLFILMRGSLLQATGITFFSVVICYLHFLKIPRIYRFDNS